MCIGNMGLINFFIYPCISNDFMITSTCDILGLIELLEIERR